MAEEIHPTTYVASRSRVPKRALVTLLLLASVCASVWYSRATLLRGAAELWVVSDPLVQTDAVAIFGGGLGVRPFAAADYYKEGLTKKILVSDVRLDTAKMLGVLPSDVALTRSVLIKLGVPETAIEVFGNGLSNTYQEAVALREWAVRTQARSVVVPTQAFSSRRVRWVLEHAFTGTGIQVKVVALDNPEYSLSDWWKDEKAVIEFQNEVIKYVYYRFKY